MLRHGGFVVAVFDFGRAKPKLDGCHRAVASDLGFKTVGCSDDAYFDTGYRRTCE